MIEIKFLKITLNSKPRVSNKVRQQNPVIRVGVQTASDEVEAQCPLGVGRVELFHTLELLHRQTVRERTISG